MNPSLDYGDFDASPSPRRDVERDIVELIRRKGPQFPSQLSAELLLPVHLVRATLRELGERRILKPDDASSASPHINVDWVAWELCQQRSR
jgi:hypothetical protein